MSVQIGELQSEIVIDGDDHAIDEDQIDQIVALVLQRLKQEGKSVCKCARIEPDLLPKLPWERCEQ